MAKKKPRKTAVSKKSNSTINTNGNIEKKKTAEDRFRLEYAYVLRDLRTVFILAGVMFALLIALNLILQ
jgi:hypothetical protein